MTAVKRWTARALVSLVAALAGLGVTGSGYAVAADIDEPPAITGDLWSDFKNFFDFTHDKTEDFMAVTAPDYECITDSGAGGVWGAVDDITGEPICFELKMGLVSPRPGLSGSLFTSTATSLNTGVALDTWGINTGAGLRASAYGLLGETQVTVDTAATDLPVNGSTPGGWAGGIQTVTSMTFDLPAGGPAFGSATTTNYQVTVEQNTGCAQADQVAFRDCWAAFYGNANFGVSLTNIMSDDSTAGSSTLSWVSFWSSSDKSRAVINASASGTVARPFDHIRLGTGVFAQTNVLNWYPEGHALYEPPTVGGLEGFFTTTVQCLGAGGAVTMLTEVAHVVTNTALLPSMTCPTGSLMGSYQVTYTDAGTGDVVEVFSGGNPEWVTDIPVEYPGCLEESCGLSLWQVQQNSPALYCGEAAVGCPQWWEAVQSNPDSYQCKYGTYSVDLSYCAVYRQPGEISPTVPTQAQADGTVTVGQRVDTVVAEDYAPLDAKKRELQDLIDQIKTNPTPQPTGTPTPTPTPPPVPEVTEARACWPTGWGIFNPFEWVYRPVSCALAWAFVPTAATTATLNGLREQLETTQPFAYGMDGAQAIAVSVDQLQDPGDCSSAPLEMETLDGETAVDWCEAASGIRATPAGGVLFVVVQALIWGGAVLIMWHRAGASLGSKA